MKVALLAALAALFLLETNSDACLRCRRVTWGLPVQQNSDLTAAIAKKALLEMDVGQIPPGVLVPWPKDEPIQVVDENTISIGIYRCNLKRRTFAASAFYPNAPRHKFNHIVGVFERNPQGKWMARVKESISGH